MIMKVKDVRRYAEDCWLEIYEWNENEVEYKEVFIQNEKHHRIPCDVMEREVDIFSPIKNQRLFVAVF